MTPKPARTALLLCFLALTFCTPRNERAAANEKPQPFSITMMNIYYSSAAPDMNSEFFRRIEEYTGTRLSITWIPHHAYSHKLHVALTSGDLPMVIATTDSKEPEVIQAIRAGEFWEIGPILRDFPNLNRMSEVLYENTAVDGQRYGVIRARDLARYGIVYRRDWLDTLGLEEPRTIEDLLEVLRAFTFRDPDRNGRNDTYGLTEHSGGGGDINGFDTLKGYFNCFNGWGIRDGRLTPDFMTREYLAAMDFYRLLYERKIITPDFTVANMIVRMEHFDKGRAGMYFGSIDDALKQDVQKFDPDACVDVIGRILNPQGHYSVTAHRGHGGVHLFPKKSVPDEQTLRRILAFFDRLCDPQMQDLLKWGIEGRHHVLVDGQPFQNGEYQVRYYNEVHQVRKQLKPWYPETEARQGIQTELEEKIQTVFQQNIRYIIRNPAESLISDTYVEKGSEADAIVMEARMKYILGEIDRDGWNRSIEAWLEKGGRKIIEEYNEAYEKSRKGVP